MAGVASYLNRGWEWLISRVLSNHENRITLLEGRMATLEQFRTEVDQFATDLSVEVDAVADRQESFQTQIDDLKAQLEAGNTQAVSDALDSLAPNMGRLREISAKLRELGSVENPIPTPLPPTPEGPGEPTG